MNQSNLWNLFLFEKDLTQDGLLKAKTNFDNKNVEANFYDSTRNFNVYSKSMLQQIMVNFYFHDLDSVTNKNVIATSTANMTVDYKGYEYIKRCWIQIFSYKNAS